LELYEYYPKSKRGTLVYDNKMEAFGRGAYAHAIADVKNIDNEAGWFTVTFVWETLEDGEVEQEVRHYIEQDETIPFETEYDIDMGEDYSISAYVEADQIEKTKTVTKYRYETVCED